MQSDLVVEAEAEISSFLPKASHNNEYHRTKNNDVETGTGASKFYPVSLSSISEKMTTEIEHTAPDESSPPAIESPLKETEILVNDEPFDQAEDGNIDFTESGGRFIMPPPKYSSLYSMSLEQKEVPLSGTFYAKQKDMDERSPRLSFVQQITGREKEIDPSSIQREGEDTNIARNDEYPDTVFRESGTKDKDSASNFTGKKRLSTKIEEYQDEKFIFSENALNKDFKIRRRSRQRRKERILAESQFTDDDMSIENYGSQLSALQERTHQAWKSRQRKNATMRIKNDSDFQSQKGSNVSFGASDTIHHFDPDIPKRYKYNNEEQEDRSLDRSLNSEYTKTLESEVEDMIKDILFIGSPEKSKPGRRKYRHKSDVGRKALSDRKSKAKKDNYVHTSGSNRQGALHGMSSRKIEDDPSPISALKFDEVDDKSKGDDTYSLGSTVSRDSSVDSNTVETFQSEKDTIDDPLNTVIGLVEGGISVMTSAIGYALGDETATQTREGIPGDCQRTTGDYDIFESCGIAIRDEKVEMVSSSQIFSRTTKVLSESPLLDTSSSNAIVEKTKKKPEVHTGQDGVQVSMAENTSKPDRQTINSGNTAELILLAMHAARSLHKLKGVEYDESVGIDMYKEVKKIHVMLELPLGIIFLENDGGCFVAKVSPDGSAARSRRVMVGDQLAAINGTSGNKMKVDDICNAVSRSTDQGQTELVFLRYTGPFRPSTVTRRSDDAPKQIDSTIASKERTSSTSWKKKPMKKITGFRLFGRGKKE